ncbi:hypothetical protein FRC08_018578, partial [Ceratobasidium sp. 394]
MHDRSVGSAAGKTQGRRCKRGRIPDCEDNSPLVKRGMASQGQHAPGRLCRGRARGREMGLHRGPTVGSVPQTAGRGQMAAVSSARGDTSQRYMGGL